MRVDDRPGNGCVCAIVRSGQQRANLFTRERNDERRGEDIERRGPGHSLPADVPESTKRTKQGNDGGQNRTVNGGQAKRPQGMTAQVAPVDDSQKQSRAGERDE